MVGIAGGADHRQFYHSFFLEATPSDRVTVLLK